MRNVSKLLWPAMILSLAVCAGAALTVSCPGPDTGLVSGTGTGTNSNGGTGTNGNGTGTNNNGTGTNANGTGNQTGSGTNNNTGTGYSGGTITVTFNSNGGSGTVASQTANAGNSITLPSGSGLIRIGFVFTGWNTNAAGTGTSYDAGSSYPVSENITLYAQWEDGAATYTVTFSANGGGGAAPSHQIVTVGTAITLPNGNALSRTGYTFGGWNTNSSGTGTNYNVGASYTVTRDITLYAKWEGMYTVTFSANSGTGTVTAQTVIPGSSITLPSGNALSRTGFTFGGWNTQANGAGTNYNAGASYTVTRDITLYAKWEGITYTVTFSANGGTGTVAAMPAQAGSGITLPSGNALSRTGFTFAGWNTQANGTGTNYNAGDSYTVTRDITLYVRWAWDGFTIFTVTYNINGGSGTTPSAQTANYDSSITLPSGSGLSRSGYIFGGWNTNVDGTGTNYNAGSSYPVTGNATLYARWIEVVVGAAGVELVRVPGGSFQMGNPDSSVGDSDERPVHTVTLTGFYMGRHEVTQGQWQAVMGSLPSSLSTGTNYGRGDAYPVYYVSWYDALVFCNKLSIAEGLTPAYRINSSTDPSVWGTVPTSSNSTWNAAAIDSNANGYRLPTEAQWEYAAKGGNGSPGNYTYSGSNTVGDVAWYSGNNGSSGTATYGSKQVGTKAANGLGIYDMSGNVWEWCWDRYGSYSSEAQTDPVGASAGSTRVERGRSWHYSAEDVRSAYRCNNYPNGRDYGIGFRLVRP